MGASARIAKPSAARRAVCRGLVAFGRARVADAARGGPAAPDDPHRYDALRALLATRPQAGTDTVIVSHGNPFRAVAGGAYLAEGEAAVIEPLGGQQFRVVARIPADAWSGRGR